MQAQEESGQLKRNRSRDSCIISRVSNDIPSFSSSNGMSSGVYDAKRVSGETVKMTVGCGSLRPLIKDNYTTWMDVTRTLQNVQSNFLYNARRRNAHIWYVRWLHTETA